MTGFYLTFLAILLAGIGARDQALVAALTLARGRRLAVIVVAVGVACLTAAFAVWAAQMIVPLLAPRARSFFAAMALALAGIESLVLVPRRRLREPTLSLGALLVVLALLQAIDAARFIVFAMAVAMHAPFAVGLAGAIGGAAVVLAGWMFPEWVTRPSVHLLRRGVGLLMLVVGIVLGLRILDLM